MDEPRPVDTVAVALLEVVSMEDAFDVDAEEMIIGATVVVPFVVPPLLEMRVEELP